MLVPFVPVKVWKRISLALFPVIPAEAGIQQGRFMSETRLYENRPYDLDPGFHRGDDKKAIFSQIDFSKGDKHHLGQVAFNDG